jgi:Zn-dependent M32 family carboxypeptidase
MYIFDVDRDGNVVNKYPEIEEIKAFKYLIKDPNGGPKAMKALIFIYDYESPYRRYINDEDRILKVCREIYDLKKRHRIMSTDNWKHAVEAYMHLQQDDSRQLLRILEKKLNQLVVWIEKVDMKFNEDEFNFNVYEMDESAIEKFQRIKMSNIKTLTGYTKEAQNLRKQIKELNDEIASQTQLERTMKIKNKTLSWLEQQYLIRYEVKDGS